MNQNKINELKKWMADQQIDLTYISDPGHIAYFSGYESDPHERVLALFISLNDEPFLFTPALEVDDAQNSSWIYPVYGYLDSENPWEKIAQLIKKNGLPNKIATEKDALTVARFELLKHYFPQSDFSENVTPIIERLQLLKTTSEISTLMEAGNWADVALEIGFKAVKEGAKEQEILAEIEYQLKRQGIRSMSFDTLVLTGENGASPHGNPGNTAVAQHDFVLFDLGVIYNGYCSDVTRTVAYKEPTDFQKEIYSIVLEAQLKAMDAVKPGITAGELDDIARGVITSYGYGEYFNHRLGHGIGTTVHEYPSLITGNDLVIEEGMCFSIEPGIYIPGKVGVRIEDCLHVTHSGCEAFTKTPKELIILD
ncbi:aminopeptidase P family protein [Candidatus Enterococcus mansonii]|uniref:Proline dipeptidase n=1 Tax=Candidatus Enterococcus mansonii TaxID=1834181 RepID=A0A242C615_9ENTE|nr:Xaa-Pro peptidase family protein [Enterococcus sp. 4G2_DIV0659]OTO05599.1 proline dipeptidase [Enterococcus sp. 4G2_DIV0659]